MFRIGTVLTRKDPRDDPYDEVKIIGVNPLKTPQVEEWSAAGNPGILLQPNKEFGETRPISFKQLSEYYTIKEESDGMAITQTTVDGVQESPEALFAREAQLNEAAATKAKEAAAPSPAETSKAAATPSPKKA